MTEVPTGHILCRWVTLRPSWVSQLYDRLCDSTIDAATVTAAVEAVQRVISHSDACCLLCHAEPIDVELLGVLVTEDRVAAYAFCVGCFDRHGGASGITKEVLSRLRRDGVPIAVLPPVVATVGHA